MKNEIGSEQTESMAGGGVGDVLSDLSVLSDDIQTDAENAVPVMSTDDGCAENGGADEGLRQEYEELIRTKYKKFYTEDAQRMISKRLKKYKDIEERLERTEAELLRAGEALELERARVDEEARRRAADIIAAQRRHMGERRPDENGIMNYRSQGKRRAADLTRTERRNIAERALRGETVKI